MTIKQQWEALDLLQECRVFLVGLIVPRKISCFRLHCRVGEKIRKFQKKVSKRRNMGKQV